LDREGKASVPIMGCYGMGVTRLVAAVIEQHHDAAGLRWPEALAPFDVHLVALNYGKSESVREAADGLLADLSAAGIEALLDDRPERPGVKFADADLLGLPKRVVIGERGLKQGCVEVRAGHGWDLEQVAPAEVKARLG
ncbi:MAG: proline--tRNA ligase, partial [Gammaproteobacteria bacterium]|nr:proline--tRNA ligase [Gammaproteobacteria bacterium]